MRHTQSSPEDPLVVVITGATAGIGRATVREFAKRGACIGLLARGKDRLKQTEKEVEKLGGRAIGIPTDVADHQQVEKAADLVEKTFGPIDIWINDAMATIFSPVSKITPEEYKRATEVTYLGYVYGTMAALKRMLPRNKGTIMQVGSALAYRAIPLQAPYCGAKFAIRGFTDSLRTELMHDKKNIHLTMVQLPAHNTPQFSWARSHIGKHPQPVPPIYQPEVAGRAIYWAAFSKRREVWLGKPAVATILMNKFFPGLADKYLADTGYSSQMTKQKIDPKKRKDNLFKPAPGNFAAHGIFDKKAKNESTQFPFEKIPVLHIFADFFFGVTTGLAMFVKYLGKMLHTGK